LGGLNNTDGAGKTTNILVVIARPQMDRDIPHRFVSSAIVKVADLTQGVRVSRSSVREHSQHSKPISAASPAASCVKYAILNACRSAAAAGSTDSNIATTLLDRGLLTVTAMSYKIVSSAVDQIVRAVYKGLLLDGLSLPARVARREGAMLRLPAKQTRYDVAVDVLTIFFPGASNNLALRAMLSSNGPLLRPCPWSQRKPSKRRTSSVARRTFFCWKAPS
jgi:hypothetical protein